MEGVGLGGISTTENSPNKFHQCGVREVDASEVFSHLGHGHCLQDTELRKRCTRCGVKIRAGFHTCRYTDPDVELKSGLDSTRAGAQIQQGWLRRWRQTWQETEAEPKVEILPVSRS